MAHDPVPKVQDRNDPPILEYGPSDPRWRRPPNQILVCIAFVVSALIALILGTDLLHGDAVHIFFLPLIVFAVPALRGFVSELRWRRGWKHPGRPRWTASAILAFVGLTIGLLAIIQPILAEDPHIRTAQRRTCSIQMREISLEMFKYADEHNGAFPDSWKSLIDYSGNRLTPEQFTCPESDDRKLPGEFPDAIDQLLSQPGHLSFVYAAGGQKYTGSPELILFYELPSKARNEGSHMAFGDGHIDFAVQPFAQGMIAELQAGHNPPRARMQK